MLNPSGHHVVAEGNSEYVNLCESFFIIICVKVERAHQACEESQHLQLYVGVKVHLVHMAR